MEPRVLPEELASQISSFLDKERSQVTELDMLDAFRNYLLRQYELLFQERATLAKAQGVHSEWLKKVQSDLETLAALKTHYGDKFS